MSTLITIYKYNSAVVRAVIDPDDKSSQDVGIMRGDVLNISFRSPTFIDFQIGDFCKLENTTYRLNRDTKWSKTGKRDFAFNFTMEGPYHQLSRPQYFTLDAHNNLAEGKFSLRYRPVDFVTLAVANLNRFFPDENWQVGSVLDGDYQTIDFDGENCLQAMSKLADIYKTEFTLDGYKLNLIQSQPNSGLVFEYGKGKALWSVERDNADSTAGIITRLYVYGSSKNLGDNYRGGAQRLRMADALYLQKNFNLSGGYEKTVVFDGSNGLPEIFPTRTGTISAVVADDTFTDAGMDFNLNDYGLPNGDKAKVTFNTGLLAGSTFEIDTYDNATKTFKILPNGSQTLPLPSDSLKPAVGDKYVLVDILMPLSYYNDAEERLKIAGQNYLTTQGPAKSTFTVGCNPVYFKANQVELKNGSALTLLVTEANVNRQIRLVGYSRSLRNRWLFKSLTLADTVIPQTPIVKLYNSIKNG